MTYGFNDNSWSDYTGSSSVSKAGTVYIRHKFTGVQNMAAYELTFYQQYGLIIYMNGVEVFRSNMPEGPVTANTASNGEYSSLLHHSIIRNGLEIEATESVVAMEYHYKDNTSSHSFRVGSFLAPYLPDVGSYCYQSYESFEVTSNSEKTASDTNGPENVFDLDPSLFWSEESVNKWIQITWERWIPQINGFYINTNGARNLHPYDFVITAGKTEQTSSMDTLLDKKDTEYDISDYTTYFSLVLNTNIYQKLRMRISKTGDSSLRFNELGLLTCRYSVPDKLELTETKVEAIAYTTSVKIAPKYEGFTSCSVSPQLPAGLAISSTTCIISGIPSVQADEKVYTITTTTPISSTATVTLSVSLCDKSIIEVERTFGTINYIYETHVIRSSSDSSKVVERVYANSVQKAGVTIKNRYCIDSGLYELTVDHTIATYWDSQSFITIKSVFGAETPVLMRWKYDLASGYSPSVTFRVGYSIPYESEWNYLQGDLPAGWNSGEMPSNWSKGKKGSFNPSTNQFQLYKAKFTLSDDPTGSAYEMAVNYNYGIIVHINGIEVFRNNIPDGLPSNDTVATASYSALKYRRFSLPTVLAASGEQPQQTVIRKGDNVVSILLVARSGTQTSATFDAALRIFGRETVGRVFGYTTSSNDGSSVPANLFDMSSTSLYTSSSCSSDRYIQIEFEDDRREWISKYVFVGPDEEKKKPYSWLLQARNTDADEWTTLDTISSSAWWGSYQVKEMWVHSNKPYNKYRIANLAGTSTTECEINLLEIGLYSDSLVREMPDLDYTGSTTGYQNVDFADLVPNSGYYSQFTVAPELPSFLVLDHVTGIIHGSRASLLTGKDFTITAKKPDGTEVTKVLTIQVIVCDKAMTTVTIRTDSFPQEMNWALYKGESASGEPIATIEKMQYKNGYEYKYFCLDKDIYTIKLQDTYGDGWFAPSGFRVLVGGYVVTLGGVPRVTEKPSVVTRTFSTNIVIPTGSTEWRVLKQSPPANWNSPSFDHTVWNKITGGEAGTYEVKTNYFRHEFQISSLTTYPVLNVAVRWGAGIIGYLNGNIVYRSNMERNPAFETSATQQRKSSSMTEFSIPLQMKGGVVGKNILAFELHRTSEMASSENNYFNGFAILATGECAIVRNDVLSYSASTPVSGYASYLFDTTSYNYISWDWTPETYFEWDYENLEGVIFNEYRFYSDSFYGKASWNMYSMRPDDKIYFLFDSIKDASLPDRSVAKFKVPNGILGYNKFKVNFNDVSVASGFTIDEIEFAYCPYSTAKTCPGVDSYPMTGDGEISVSFCPDYYEGYSYRECVNGRLGEVKLDKCTKLAPTKVEFEEPIFTIYAGIEVTTIVPKVYGLVDDFQIMPPLPDGLRLDTKTGAVKGAAKNTTSQIETYTVTAYNEKGSAEGTFQLKIIVGYCDAEDEFPTTLVGKTVEYNCKDKGDDYYGTLKRTCQVGESGPEWGKVSGMCLTKGSFTALGVLLVVVIIVVILAVIKVIRDKKTAKARTGVRGGKKNHNIMKSVPYAKI